MSYLPLRPDPIPDFIDIPEECPICGKPNADEGGNPVCEYEAFCSEACCKQYMAEQRKAADDYFYALKGEERLIADYNSNCILCGGTHKKLCLHQDNDKDDRYANEEPAV